MNKWVKASLVTACLVFSASLYYTFHTGTIYPGLGYGTATVAVLLFVTFLRVDGHTVEGIAAFTLLSVANRVYAFVFPPSLVRFDPGREAVKSQLITETGGTNVIVDGFYSKAAGFNILGAQSGLVTGLPIEDAYIIFPLFFSVALPLAAAVMTDRIADDPTASLIACALVSVSGVYIQYGTAPIPMILGSVFVAATFIIILIVQDRFDTRVLVLLTLFVVAAGLSHKIPLFLLLIGVAVSVVYAVIAEYFHSSQRKVTRYFLVSYLAIFLILQWLYYTEYLNKALVLIFASTNPTPSAAGSVAVSTSIASSPVQPPLQTRVWYFSYYLLSVFVGGLAGLELFRSSGQRNIRLLQSVGFVMVAVSVPGMFIASAPGFNRVFVYGAVFAASIISLGMVRLQAGGRQFSKPLSVGLVILLLIVNPVSPFVAPDSSAKADRYLSKQEIAGKEFSNERIESTVFMDTFYNEKRADIQSAARGGEFEQQGIPPWLLQDLGYLQEELLNASLLDRNYKYVAVRTNIEIYRLLGGQYRLHWSPEDGMNRTYNKIYANGDVSIYRHSDITTTQERYREPPATTSRDSRHRTP